MSEEEIKAQRANLLLELDDQKRLVAHLQVRDRTVRDAFKAFAESYDSPERLPEIVGNKVRIWSHEYALIDLDATTAIERRKETVRAEERLHELQMRAAHLGISLK